MARKRKQYEEEEIPPVTTVTGDESLPMPEDLQGTIQTYAEELSGIRAKSIRMQVNTAHTIAELEALRADIDATLAVLRSQRK